MTLYAALLLGYTIHFIYCIWGNLRITVAELIAAMPRHCAMLLATETNPKAPPDSLRHSVERLRQNYSCSYSLGRRLSPRLLLQP